MEREEKKEMKKKSDESMKEIEIVPERGNRTKPKRNEIKQNKNPSHFPSVRPSVHRSIHRSIRMPGVPGVP